MCFLLFCKVNFCLIQFIWCIGVVITISLDDDVARMGV